MISCRKGARLNVRDEIDMRLPYVCDRVFFERRKGDGKEAISSSVLGKVTMKRYQGLQDRDFESINCEQRAKPSSFVVPYVVVVRVWRGALLSRRRHVVVASSSRRCHVVSGERILILCISVDCAVADATLVKSRCR